MDRGRETGRALAEIRTVLGRAETALSTIENWPEIEPGNWVETGEVRLDPAGREYRPMEFVSSGPATYDPDLEEMREALRTTISSLAKWRKTGKATKDLSAK